MTRRYLPLMVAVFVTALLGAVFSVVGAMDEVPLPLLGFLSLINLATPLVVPLIWAWALLLVRPLNWVLIAATVWVVASAATMPMTTTLPLTTEVVSGLLVAWGLMARWKPGIILLLLGLVSVPVVVWSLNQMPLDEMLAEQKELVLETRREFLMQGTREGDEPPSLVQEEQALDELFQTLNQMQPGATALGLLGQAALTFYLVWVLVRVLGLAAGLRGLPTFGRWRMPFAVIWLLAAGVGLMIVPNIWWPAAGNNLVLFVVGLLAVQGAAVQWQMSPRTVPILLRLILLFMAGFLFLPLVLLGLADQWLDFRKLDHRDPEGPDDNGGNDDDPAADEGG